MATFRLSVSGLAHEPSDHGAQTKQAHHANDPKRNHAVNAPDFENVFLNVREVEGEGESSESRNEQQAIRTREGERGHEDVSDDADDGDGDGTEHGVGTVVDDATIPVFIDAARGVSVFAVVFAESERGNGDAKDGEDDEDVFHLACSLMLDARAKAPIS